ncbi:hypothetical protein [Lignipirellula cremea]|nr:hypothetical protein [Lignipirellula cremea]
MHPNICPAIKKANMKGVLLSALHDIKFDGPESFDVRLGSTGQNTVLVVPGVIGSPNSTVLFAKLDTGFSVDELPVEILSLPILDLEFSMNLIVPGVIYPKGYCGPLFIAVAARKAMCVQAGYPLTQLVALNHQDLEITVSPHLATSSHDQRFEGLLHPGWQDILKHGCVVTARRCLELFEQYTEELISKTLLAQ